MDICGWCGAEFDNKTYLHICDDCVVVAEECCNRATERGKSLEHEIINKQPNAHSFVKLRTQKDGCECADDILKEAIANAN